MAYQERYIEAYGRTVLCQILNWQTGEPPKYLVCNPLHKDMFGEFLAAQRMGAWMRVSLVEAMRELNNNTLEQEITEKAQK